VGVIIAVGLEKAPSQSTGYTRAVDRSYADQIRLVVAASTDQGKQFRALVASMPQQTRTSLEASLDTLVRATASTARQAATAATPAPAGRAGPEIAAAMADRAAAARGLRTAVDRFLVMTPLPVIGAPDAGAQSAGPRPISVAGAAAALARVGRLLVRGDRSYAAGRKALEGGPGHQRLPRSAWSGRAQTWTPAGVLTLVDALRRSTSLAPVRRVQLLTDTLALTPAPVPAPSATQRIAVVPPTGRLGVTVVIENGGNVAERGIEVHEVVASAGGAGAGSADGRRGHGQRINLTAHSSETVSLPPVSVVPGHRYTVTVTVVPPVPDAPGASTSDTVSARIAPPGPPTVAQLLPAKGRGRGGTEVTILGSGFTWVSAVTFGSRPARFKVVSSTQITAVAPPGTGTVTVHVTNPGGTSLPAVGDQFRYRGRP
jgi:hypothetical protein